MKDEQQQFMTLPRPSATPKDDINTRFSTTSHEQQITTAVESVDQRPTEEYRRLLLENDMSAAQTKGYWTCRLWQFVLILNITIILTTGGLVILLLFIIGPLSPYKTYGQSCQASTCNTAQGLICNSASVCVCPSSDSYWSRNAAGCRRCPNNWSMVNRKCLFISTFPLNWTDAFAYCQSFTAQLLTFSTAKLSSSFTFIDISPLISSNTNYFIGLAEEPNDSNQWQWVDGSPLSSSSMNLFCPNGTINQFDPFFRTNMNCGIYRMDGCFARCECQRIDNNFMCEKI